MEVNIAAHMLTSVIWKKILERKLAVLTHMFDLIFKSAFIHTEECVLFGSLEGAPNFFSGLETAVEK